MKNDKILDRIKKMLALSKSSEPHEAAAALRQAQKLMAEHNISGLDVTQSEIRESNVKSRVSVSRPKVWETTLMNVIARAFGCELLWSPSYSHASDYFGEWVFIGLNDQAELAQYTAVVLQRKLMNTKTAFAKTIPSHWSREQKSQQVDGYCTGWVRAVKATVQIFARPEAETQLLLGYLESLKTSKASVQKKRELGALGYNQGLKDGEGESLHRPVNTTYRAPARLTQGE